MIKRTDIKNNRDKNLKRFIKKLTQFFHFVSYITINRLVVSSKL